MGSGYRGGMCNAGDRGKVSTTEWWPPHAEHELRNTTWSSPILQWVAIDCKNKLLPPQKKNFKQASSPTHCLRCSRWMEIWEGKKISSLLKERQNMDTLQKKEIIWWVLRFTGTESKIWHSLLLYMPPKALQKFLCASFSKIKLMFSIATSFTLLFPYFLPYAASHFPFKCCFKYLLRWLFFLI